MSDNQLLYEQVSRLKISNTSGYGLHCNLQTIIAITFYLYLVVRSACKQR